jgi:hypothetical protein
MPSRRAQSKKYRLQGTYVARKRRRDRFDYLGISTNGMVKTAVPISKFLKCKQAEYEERIAEIDVMQVKQPNKDLTSTNAGVAKQ